MISKIKIFSLEEVADILADCIVCQTQLIRCDDQPLTVTVLADKGVLKGLRVETKARELTEEELNDIDL